MWARFCPSHHCICNPIYLSLDGRCTPLPSIENAIPDSNKALNGTTIHYQCAKGHLFPTKLEVHTVYCDGMSWNVSETRCDGKALQYSHHIVSHFEVGEVAHGRVGQRLCRVSLMPSSHFSAVSHPLDPMSEVMSPYIYI